MPALTYTVADFIPFTKILSADVNSRFNDIKVLLNTTKLDTTNIQQYGIARDRIAGGTANYAVYNDASGYLTQAASLPTTAGGLGFIPTINAGNAGKVVGVNDAGNALELRSPESAVIIEQFANNVATLTAGENINTNDAVVLAFNEGVYKVFKADADANERKDNFAGFALATATTTAQVTDLTKGSSWTSGTVSVTINSRVYSQAYATSNDNSMTTLATTLSGDPDVASAAVQGGSPYNTIRVTGRGGLTLTITLSSSGGAPTLTPSTVTSPSGSSVRIQMFGPLSGFTGLTVGDLYYTSSTAGAITNSPDVSSPVFVGQAISTTTLMVSPNRFDFTFSLNSFFIKAHGTSTTAESAALSNVEHFNTISWSTGTTDSQNWCSGNAGNSSYNNLHHKGDGRDSGGQLQVFKSYNKTSWASLTNRSNHPYNYCSHSFNSYLYFNQGDVGGAQTYADKWNGSAWASATAWSYSCAGSGNFVVGTNLDVTGGNVSGAKNDHNTRTTADSVSVATNMPASGAGSISENATGSLGIATSPAGTTASYTWSGSAWSSSITSSITYNNDFFASLAFIAGKQKTYYAGGYVGAGTVTTAQTFNGTAFASGTACSVAACETASSAI